MSIRIIQHLCPQRHCIMATVYDAPNGRAEPSMVATLEANEREIGLDPWCGICGSRDLHFEDAPTKFQTMDEAMPQLQVMLEEQIGTRMYIEHLRRKVAEN